MLDIYTVQAKKGFYLNKLAELQNVDIETEVNKRLEETKAAIRNEIEKELNEDIKTCNDYIKILDELIDEANMTSCNDTEQQQVENQEV